MLGRRDEALSHLQTSLQLRPNDPEVLYFAGLVNAQLGKKTEAIYWLKQSVSRGYSVAEIASTPEFEMLSSSSEFRRVINRSGEKHQ